MIGIYGGAFDPPHSEHIKIVRELLREHSFEKIVIVPSCDPPHKTLLSSFAIRKRMIEKAFQGLNIIIDSIEESFSGKAYSSEILPLLKSKYGEISFIIGGDSLLAFSTWHLPQDILKVCPILVIPRGEEEIKLLRSVALRFMTDWGGRIEVSEKIKGEDISSSEIRAAVELDADTPYLDPAVRAIIEEEKLYKDHSEMVEKVKSSLPEKRWDHTRKVVLTGLKMNAEIGLPREKVFVACLLHDCMKYAEKVYDSVPKDTIGTKVLHAFNGAEEARFGYGIEDEDILNAVRYHTTGRAGMSPLEKLVYVADMIEPNRTFEGVEELRALTKKSLDLGFEACIRYSYANLALLGKPIYYLTVECYNYYCKGDENGEG